MLNYQRVNPWCLPIRHPPKKDRCEKPGVPKLGPRDVKAALDGHHILGLVAVLLDVADLGKWVQPIKMATCSHLKWRCTLWLCLNSYGKWPFIVDFPIKNGGSFHSYVSLPEGKLISPSKIKKKNVTKMLRQESWHSMIFHDIQPPTSIVCITSTGVKHQPPFPVMFPPRWEISKTPTSAESFHILPHMYMCMYIYI